MFPEELPRRLIRMFTFVGETILDPFLGSGTTAENIAEFLCYADGAIVGSSLILDGVAENPVDVERVRRYMEVVRAVRQT